MKYIFKVTLLLLTLIPGLLQAKATSRTTLTIEGGVPADVDAFLAFRDEMATTPEGGAVVMLVALMKLMEDEAMGRKFLVIALDRKNLSSGDDYKNYSPANALNYHLDRITLPNRHHLPYAYLVGATPQNDYKVALPWKVKLERNKSSHIKDDQIKVFVHCYGTDWPRPVTLKKNNRGIWKAYEFSSLFLDVVGPDSQTRIDDDI